MAGRTSSSITPETAQNIFENTTSGPVVVSINAISSDNTVNPKLSLLIDSSNTRPLNFISAAKTLVETVTENTGDFDLKSSGDNGVTRLQNVVGTSKHRLGVNGTSYSADYYKYTQYDPYFLTNPQSYNKASAYGALIATSQPHFYSDIAADKSYFPNWLQGSSPTSGSTYVSSHNFNYYNSFFVTDIWTDTVIGISTSAYMGAGQFHGSITTPSFDEATQSSGSLQYALGSSSNPDSFKVNDGLTLDLQSDGGVYVLATGTSKTSNNSYRVGLISARQWRNNGNYTAGASSIKNAKDTTTSQNENSLISTGEVWHARLEFNLSSAGGHSLSWIKYNPTTDKYYLNVQSSSSNNGVWSFDHPDMFVSGYTVKDFDTVCTKEPATHPLTVKTSQPERIGASLWVAYKSAVQGDVLYSTDLINWKTASEMGYPSATLLAVDNSGSSERILFLQSTQQDTLFAKTTGFSSIPQTGLLENGSAIGVYERNGLVLGSGDCLYAENQDAAATVHTTVTFVEV